MRLIVLFDLPMESSAEKRSYRKFRKFLIKNGFMMIQKSVYCKLVLNGTQKDSVKEQIIKNKPSKGVVHILAITEKQYLKMESIVDDYERDVLDSYDRTIIL